MGDKLTRAINGGYDAPIYKTLCNLNTFKKQIKFSPVGRKKTLENFLKQYNSAIKEAKEYRNKAPKESNTKDIFKAAGSAVMTGSYVSPKQITNRDEWDKVIKELTACKKYIESELKHLESAVCESVNNYSSLFNFEFE